MNNKIRMCRNRQMATLPQMIGGIVCFIDGKKEEDLLASAAAPEMIGGIVCCVDGNKEEDVFASAPVQELVA